MSIWKEMRRDVIEELTLVTKERTDRRNQHGAAEYIIEVYRGDELVHEERHPWNVHCNGILLQEAAKRAEAKLTREAAGQLNTWLST